MALVVIQTAGRQFSGDSRDGGVDGCNVCCSEYGIQPVFCDVAHSKFVLINNASKIMNAI
jgi:hypothetical protein